MKKHLLLSLILLVISFFVFAQVPQGISYQAVVRSSTGQLIQNSAVGVEFVIHDDSTTGPVLFIQRDTVITNQFGLINVVIGGGITVQGSFTGINWARGSKFMQVELDPAGGTNYIDMGTTQMLSVPYALFAGAVPPNASDSIWLVSGNNIYNSNSGNVGIQTDTPQSALTVNGYSMLGIDAPPIKMKEFTGVTPGIIGGSTSFITGIPDSSVRDINVLVHDPINGLLTPLLNLLNVQYSYTYLSSVFTLSLNALNSSAITGKPYTVLVTYRQ